MPTVYRAQTADARQILLAMGMGQFNATMVIPYLFIAPATTDADMAQVMMLVELIQRRLNSLGAELEVSGRIDAATSAALSSACGPNWPKMSWYEICRILIARTDTTVAIPGGSRGRSQAMSGFLGLPEIPNELVLLGAGLVAWHFYKKRKKGG